MLEALERGNLFVVPLDDRRQWYRYHHLFADVLQAHLLDEQPGQVPALHRRASAWYEQHGQPSEAIRHALAAGTIANARRTWSSWPRRRCSRADRRPRCWPGSRPLPDEVIAVRPVLSVFYAGALLLNGKLAGVDARLRNAEQWLDHP